MSAEMLPEALLKRKAIVYVRQSTQTQVQTNLESRRRQYDLVEVACRHGFASVEVIDDDLGRSASGSMARPGFDRVVATVCAGEVGAVLCLDASRLARNGRDWNHLIELCGLVGARVIDTDGIYAPHRPTERSIAARHEGQHQRVRTWCNPYPHARCQAQQGTSWRPAHQRANRPYLASRDRIGVRPKPASIGSCPCRLRTLASARQRPAGTALPRGRRDALSPSLRRQDAREL